MTTRPILPRALARQDVEQAVDFYAATAGVDIALRFIDAVEATYRAIAGFPGAGSPRYAQELNLPGLRSRRVPGFPYLIFYVEREEAVDVWRVLHAQRDIPSWIEPPDDG